jgi:hypothetical protein
MGHVAMDRKGDTQSKHDIDLQYDCIVATHEHFSEAQGKAVQIENYAVVHILVPASETAEREVFAGLPYLVDAKHEFYLFFANGLLVKLR